MYTFLRVAPAGMYTILRVATSIGLRAEELSATNSWWRDRSWKGYDLDLRAAREHGLDYRSGVLDGLESGSLYLLRGPRRVGKTVAVKQAIHDLTSTGVDPRSVVRVAADGWAVNDIRTVVQNVALPRLPDGQHRWWFFDEISGVTGDWAAAIKWLRDNDAGFADATVVLTGSDAHSLTAASGVLAGRRGHGRRTDRALLPVGFHTFVELVDDLAPDLARIRLSDLHTRTGADAYDAALPWLSPLLKRWEQYVGCGGFPVAVAAARTGIDTPAWFVDDVFSVVFRDAFARSSLSETATAGLFSRVMTSMASPLNLTSAGRDVGVSHEVAARHVEYLEASYLAWRCPQKAENSWTARQRAQDKIYAIDPLIARLTHLRSVARPDIDPTVLVEMQLGVALRRALLPDGASWDADTPLFHTRTAARKEIDFVAEFMAGAAVEGKYTDTGNWRSQAATVASSPHLGVLATRTVLDTDDTAGPWAVPAAILAYLIDS